MDIEQRPPNRPNFPLIVTWFCAALLVIFGIAYLVVRHSGTHILPATPNRHALLLPAPLRARVTSPERTA